MEQPGRLPVPGEMGSKWAALIQQQVLQTAIPHIVQQIIEQVVARPRLGSLSNSHLGVDQVDCGMGSHGVLEDAIKESKVEQPEMFLGKRSNKVYRWFAQLWLVFCGKSQSYHSNADKVAFSLLYMAGVA